MIVKKLLLPFCWLPVLLLACNDTTAPLLAPTATATLMPPITLTSPTTACIPWTEINASHQNMNICVLGNILAIENAKGGQFYFIRFADRATPAFYIMQNFESDVQAGDCISVTGTLQFDTNGVPFIDGGEIKHCTPLP